MRFIYLPLLRIIANHTTNYPTPININYYWSFGSLIGLYLVIQIITGVLLAMYYTPSTTYAFISVEYIMRNVNNGWIIRYTHANGASFLFIFLYFHILRGLFFKSYYSPRFHLWLTGVIIFILMMATAFLGYVLPWGQMSFWGATVITNLFSAIPFIGSPLVQWLWGGFAVDNNTLVRFFSLHYLIPFIIIVVVIVHMYFLHVNGSSTPFSINISDKIMFLPYFYIKDFFGLVLSFGIFAIIVFFFPDSLGHPDNYIPANPIITPSHIVPEWYFLPFYAILRSIPNKLGGVLCMFGAIFSLIIMCWFSTILFQYYNLSLTPHINFVSTNLLYLFIVNSLLLGWLGAQPIEYPFTLISILLTCTYFLLLIGFPTVFILLDNVCLTKLTKLN